MVGIVVFFAYFIGLASCRPGLCYRKRAGHSHLRGRQLNPLGAPRESTRGHAPGPGVELVAGEDLTYVVDDLDRIIARQITGGATQETFGYASSGGNDGRIGNITSKTTSGDSQTYTYGSKPHAVTDVGGQPYSYDPNGNMTQRGTGQYIKYDAENRPVKISSDSGGSVYIARFGTDGDGKRVKRVVNYGTTHYAGPHYERNVGTGADTTETFTRFYHAQMGSISRLVAFRKGSTLYYVVPDHLGSTFRVVDTSGNTIDDIRYHTFGSTRSGGTNLKTDKRFTGQILDGSTGLYYYGTDTMTVVGLIRWLDQHHSLLV